MNRRNFLSFIGLAPIATAAPKEIGAKRLPPSPHLLGEIQHRPIYGIAPVAYAGSIEPTIMLRPEIWDGERFVDLNGPEGIAVSEKLMSSTSALLTDKAKSDTAW